MLNLLSSLPPPLVPLLLRPLLSFSAPLNGVSLPRLLPALVLAITHGEVKLTSFLSAVCNSMKDIACSGSGGGSGGVSAESAVSSANKCSIEAASAWGCSSLRKLSGEEMKSGDDSF